MSTTTTENDFELLIFEKGTIDLMNKALSRIKKEHRDFKSYTIIKMPNWNKIYVTSKYARKLKGYYEELYYN